MKLKILNVKKNYDNFTMKNGGTLYAVWGELDVDGKLESGKVVSFTDKIKLSAGAEYVSGDSCDSIKRETKQYQGQDGSPVSYTQFTVYAKKSEYKAGGGSGWKAQPKISVKEFETMIAWCDARARNLAPDAQLCWSYFATLLKTAERVDWSDKPAPVQAPAAFEDASPAANSFDDSNIPF